MQIVLYFKDQPTAWWMVSTATARIAKEARKASAEWRSADVKSTETKKEQVGRSLFRDMFWMSVCVKVSVKFLTFWIEHMTFR